MTTPQGPGDAGENKPIEPMPAAPAINEQEMSGGPTIARPKSVDNAWLLWMIGAGLSVLGLIVTLTAGAGDIRRSAEESLKSSNTNYTQDELDSLVAFSTGLAVVVSVVMIGLFVLFAYKMRAGRNWARITLTVLGGIIILLTLFGIAGAGVASLIVGLVQALLVVGAVYFMFRPDANQYFLAGRVRR